jgi:hypothetical protein
MSLCNHWRTKKVWQTRSSQSGRLRDSANVNWRTARMRWLSPMQSAAGQSLQNPSQPSLQTHLAPGHPRGRGPGRPRSVLLVAAMIARTSSGPESRKKATAVARHQLGIVIAPFPETVALLHTRTTAAATHAAALKMPKAKGGQGTFQRIVALDTMTQGRGTAETDHARRAAKLEVGMHSGATGANKKLQSIANARKQTTKGLQRRNNHGSEVSVPSAGVWL